MHRLGAKANVYHVNYYGEMSDGINAGLPSDRLEAVWLLNDTKSAAERPEPDMGNPQNSFLTFADVTGKPQQSSRAFQNPFLYIEIPADIGILKRADSQLALEWRLAVRESMQQAFAQGFSIVDFLPLADRWAYVLTAPVPWFMYVIECSDGSLYTGITLDIERRLKQHNAGKGAAYTATRRPVSLRAAWRYADQSSALKAEAAFKKKSREQKLNALNTRLPLYNGSPVEPK